MGNPQFHWERTVWGYSAGWVPSITGLPCCFDAICWRRRVYIITFNQCQGGFYTEQLVHLRVMYTQSSWSDRIWKFQTKMMCEKFIFYLLHDHDDDDDDDDDCDCDYDYCILQQLQYLCWKSPSNERNPFLEIRFRGKWLRNVDTCEPSRPEAFFFRVNSTPKRLYPNIYIRLETPLNSLDSVKRGHVPIF